jgi:serine/threonine-protein kinase RsbW
LHLEEGANVADTKPLAEVALEIPGRPEYVGVARLAILGVASRMRFSYDEVEDIRLAVGEACTRSIDALGKAGESERVRLRCLIDSNRLTIEVRNPVARPLPRPELPTDPTHLPADGELGGVLIRILMDEVDSAEEAGTQVLRMVKYVAK